MTKCLSCGHLRHDLELNCPKCGSFYSTMVDDFATPEEVSKPTSVKLVNKIKTHLEHQKNQMVILGVTIFMLILLGLFL